MKEEPVLLLGRCLRRRIIHVAREAFLLVVFCLLASVVTAQDRYEPILSKIRNGDLPAAESELKRIIEVSPNDPFAQFYLGTAYATRRDYVGAIDAYREAIRLEPRNAQFHIALGYAYKDIARYQDAIKSLTAGIARDSKNAQARFTLGAIYHVQEKDESAIRELEEGLRYDPNNLEASLMLADASLLTSAFGKAKEIYARVAERHPKNIHAQLGLASIFAMTPDTYASAAELLQNVVALEPKNFDASYQLGLVYMKMNRDQDAIGRWRVALELNPESAGAHATLGRLLVKAGRREEGETHLERFKEITARKESERKSKTYAEDLLRQGRDLAWRNKLREAVTKFDGVLKIDPDSAAAHAMLCKIYLSMNDVSRARQHIGQTLRLESFNSEYRYLFGLVLKEQKNYEQAIAEIKQAVILNPDFTDAFNILGNLYSDLHRHSEAVPFYLKALALDPSAPEPHFNLASAYRQLGKSQDSEKELAIYKKLSAGK